MAKVLHNQKRVYIFVVSKLNDMEKQANNQSVTEMAIIMVIMDAIERGRTNPKELAEYMKSTVFYNAVSNYKKMIKSL